MHVVFTDYKKMRVSLDNAKLARVCGTDLSYANAAVLSAMLDFVFDNGDLLLKIRSLGGKSILPERNGRIPISIAFEFFSR